MVAIDGPGASGKTAVGLALARGLGYRFVDTGVMYRAVTWLALAQEIHLDEEEALGRLAGSLSLGIVDEEASPSGSRLLVDGRDLSGKVHSPEVDRAVSQVSRAPGVRRTLMHLQRAIAEEGRVVMAGRDIGTVVVPDAPLKLFLLASPEERARRRFEEERGRGGCISYREVLEELKRRDRLDTERPVSPLVPAEDAHHIDTNQRTIEQVLEEIWGLMGRAQGCSTSP